MEPEETRLVVLKTSQIVIKEPIEEPQPNETVLDLIPQLIASSLMYLLVIQAGISMSFSSVLITQLSDNGEIELDTNSASIIASIWSLSLPLGALSSGYLMDRFGRRKTALFICFPFIFAWLLVSFARTIEVIYLARIILGITTGLTTCCVVYVAEISSKTTRSGLLCMNSVWVSFGILLTYILNFFDLHWRTIGFAYAVLSSICILAIFTIPESPHWLLVFNKKNNEEGRRNQVRSTYEWIYKKQQLSRKHYDDLLAANSTRVRDDEIENFNWFENLKKPQVFRPLMVLLFLFLLQQFAGGYVLIFYTLNIFRNLGAEFLQSVDERLALVLVGLIRIVMAIIAAVIAQKCNRKVLLYISTIGMGIFAFIAATQMAHLGSSAQSLFARPSNITAIESESTSSGSSNYLLLICILSYMVFASLGILIIPWTLVSELYSIKYKAKFGGVSIAIAYVLMSLVLKIFPYALEAVSISVIFAFFGVVSISTAVFVFFFLPETHRKTFAEIEEYFVGKN